jgi:peptidyl-prolyl cis-trans isomerase C
MGSPSEVAADSVRRGHAVARIGSQDTVSVGELEDRIEALGPEQRRSLGGSANAMRRGYLMNVVVREKLLLRAAQERKLDSDPAVLFAIDRVLAKARVRALRGELTLPSSVTTDDMQAYYAEHQDRFNAPERYLLWRILCKSRDEAHDVLSAAQQEPTAAKFAELARDHSLDKATRLRSGNLGFLTPDGLSIEPGLTVSPSVVHAAAAVKDGQFVPQIRDAVKTTKLKSRTDQILAALRGSKVRDENAALLETLSTPGVR